MKKNSPSFLLGVGGAVFFIIVPGILGFHDLVFGLERMIRKTFFSHVFSTHPISLVLSIYLLSLLFGVIGLIMNKKNPNKMGYLLSFSAGSLVVTVGFVILSIYAISQWSGPSL